MRADKAPNDASPVIESSHSPSLRYSPDSGTLSRTPTHAHPHSQTKLAPAAAAMGSADATGTGGAPAVQPGDPPDAVQAPPTPRPPQPRRPRLYYIDTLRVFLTVLVVVHHVFSSYAGQEVYWFVQAREETDQLLATYLALVTSGPMGQYAMCLFFLLAGYFTPGSFARKGAWRHVQDRVIRLLIPTVVFALLIFPLILTVNKAAGIPPGSKALLAPIRDMTYAQLWSNWYLHWFNIAPGPTWFVWMLFWFDVGFVLVQLIKAAARRVLQKRRQAQQLPTGTSVAAPQSAAGVSPASGSSVSDQRDVSITVDDGSKGSTPAAAQGSSAGSSKAQAEPFSIPAVLAAMAALIVVFTVVAFAGLMATYDNRKVSYNGFVLGALFVNFRPSWLGPNAICFAIGCQAAKSNLLARLPGVIAPWCLGAAALWWPLGVLMPSYLDTPSVHPATVWGTHPVPAGAVCYVLYHVWASWSFAVVWGVGLLVVFRDHFNQAPGAFGRQAVAGAYGAYVIHPLFISLWAWAFMGVPFATLAGAAIATSPLVVASSWGLTALVRLVPITRRVLG